MRAEVRAALWSIAILVPIAAACDLEDGEGCTSDAECASGEFCAAPHVCLTGCNSRCTSECTRTAGEGEPCLHNTLDPRVCAQDLFCNMGSGTCTTHQPLGGPCGHTADCEGAGQGPFCDPYPSRTCTLPGSRSEGEVCGDERACGPDLTCRGGVCLPALADGQGCAAAPASCADGLACVEGECSS